MASFYGVAPNKTQVLNVPRLHHESEPTQTNMRSVQLWARQQPQTTIQGFEFGPNGLSSFVGGIQPPANVPIIHASGVLTDTDIGGSGAPTLPFATTFGFQFAYGYNVQLTPVFTTAPQGGPWPIITLASTSNLEYLQFYIGNASSSTGGYWNFALYGELDIVYHFTGA